MDAHEYGEAEGLNLTLRRQERELRIEVIEWAWVIARTTEALDSDDLETVPPELRRNIQRMGEAVDQLARILLDRVHSEDGDGLDE